MWSLNKPISWDIVKKWQYTIDNYNIRAKETTDNGDVLLMKNIEDQED
jgi:hypothetical protein